MAVDVLKYISKSDIERMRYEDEILAEIDHEEDIETALRQERTEIAKNFLKMGLSIIQIANGTGLDVETIEKIKEEFEEDK